MTKKRERREFTEEFKHQMVQLYNSDKSSADAGFSLYRCHVSTVQDRI